MDTGVLLSAKEMILASRKAAAAHIEKIKSAPDADYELVRHEVREYIKAKFHLTEDDCVTDNFSKLAEISLAKSMQISRELVAEFDLARSCDGVSSHTAKMVLLYMALQKDLGIKFQPMDTVNVESVDDISAMVWNELQTLIPSWDRF